MALTEREKAILRLKTEGISDKIAATKDGNAPVLEEFIEKNEHTRADLEFVNGLKFQRSHQA